MIHYLNKLVRKETLTEQESYRCFKEMLNAPIAQQSAILSLLAMRGETIEEICGFIKFIREKTTKIIAQEDAIDIVGTGGDQLKTFNISTAASLVVASCGVKVAKHGGKAVTSHCGSADVIECLGLPAHQSPTRAAKNLEKYHFTYLRASFFNSFFNDVSPLRKELGIASVFNILGPIANPAAVTRQVVGVYKQDLLIKLTQVLKRTGSTHVMVIRSEDGMDEFSVSAPTHVVHLRKNKLKEYILSAEDVGLKTRPIQEVMGGAPPVNAQIISDIFANKRQGACLDIVLFNAAAGLVVADRVASFTEGISLARKVIESGEVFHNLQRMKGDKDE